jgi:hypothetical protein
MLQWRPAKKSSTPPTKEELHRLASLNRCLTGEPFPEVDVIDGADVLVMSLPNLEDDSLGGTTWVVWYDDSGVERAFLITSCKRGVAVDDAGQPTDLCI